IRKIEAGIISTFAELGTCGASGTAGPIVDPRVFARTLAVDGEGNLYIGGGGDCTVRKVSAGNITTTTVAGNGDCMYIYGDGGPATMAGLRGIESFARDQAGRHSKRG